MPGERTPDRRILRLTGPDTRDFLQGLVSNDVGRLKDGLVYAALLTPQGKYLADFFLVPEADGESVLLDVKAALADGLIKRLNMYRLRAKVQIAEADMAVVRGLGPVPEGAFADPRDPGLGWRGYGLSAGEGETDWDALRVARCIPESGIELVPEETLLLEAGFERLNGVDFRKGCYVGQEVTARMKHKTELRKGLRTVTVEGAAPVGTQLMTEGGKTAGTLYTQSGGRAIAFLRLDRAEGVLHAGAATVTA
ncbi:CAF17-like 4Fe-4S cluster assembly/insertion protein YgfZ [Acidimangrovimonas sediminis]|uniref:CAF17-like 4Fe-4S cluster assembly/insertion protein YgfZ n=1 Tax=Acidimangrovimonas sediminis TaxID=2056283 RepID=UPI000C803D8E|nr:folate-binding protein YgfZ [Acidimangrovimonas sediminis]